MAELVWTVPSDGKIHDIRLYDNYTSDFNATPDQITEDVSCSCGVELIWGAGETQEQVQERLTKYHNPSQQHRPRGKPKNIPRGEVFSKKVEANQLAGKTGIEVLEGVTVGEFQDAVDQRMDDWREDIRRQVNEIRGSDGEVVF